MRIPSKNRTIYSILILFCIIGFWLFDNFYTPSTYSESDKESTNNEFPADFLPNTTTGEVVNHSYYTLSYNEDYEQAEWVAYVLKKEHLTYDDRKRPYFIEDPWVRTKSADWRNYKGSGYDRGHLVPAGDRRFSEQAYNETFYTSNVSPQNREFNAGLWNRLEKKTRQWAKKHGVLYVVTGGVLQPGLKEIGSEDVAVPDYFYKIVARKNKGAVKAIAFLMPNKEQNTPMQKFVVSIDHVEQLTGIDFFQKLDIEKQAILESGVALDNWKF